AAGRGGGATPPDRPAAHAGRRRPGRAGGGPPRRSGCGGATRPGPHRREPGGDVRAVPPPGWSAPGYRTGRRPDAVAFPPRAPRRDGRPDRPPSRPAAHSRTPTLLIRRRRLVIYPTSNGRTGAL